MRADFGAEHINLSSVQFTPELLRVFPGELVRKFRVLPISQSATELKIAMADPSNLNAVDALARHFNRPIYIYVADKGQVDAFIERLYGNEATPS